MIGTATPTLYGWLCSWNTTTVPNASYVLVSEAFNSAGSAFSSGVSMTVKNPLPTTSVLVPAKGATLSGTATLDASASNATSVEFWLFGGSYGLTGKMIGTATPTLYGWLCSWNTTTVPNASYVLVSEAFNSAGSAFSSGVSMTVKNAAADHERSRPCEGGDAVGHSRTLDASASNATSVEFWLFGGSYGLTGKMIGTATPHPLRMVVQLEHHDGTQRLLRPRVRSLQLGWERLQFGCQHDGQELTTPSSHHQSGDNSARVTAEYRA